MLSPKLLTNELCESYADCYINDKCINHIMYEGDICLMAHTGIALQNLSNVCHNFGIANANDILFYLSVLFIYLKVTNYSVLRY